MKVLIAGGGIGGLSAALSLHRAGIECRVFESVERLRPLGVGIVLGPAAVRELRLLGLETQLAAASVPIDSTAHYDEHGRFEWREPVNGGEDEGQALAIHRGRLHLILLTAVRQRMGHGAVREGHRIERFEDDGSSVTTWFGDGQPRERGDALVGADGIRSQIRSTFYPDERSVRFTGRLVWRGLTDAPPPLDGRTMIEAGSSGRFFAAHPVMGGKVNWVAGLCTGSSHLPMPRDWNRPADRSVFAPAFQDWRFDWLDVPALISAAHETYEFPMVDRDPLPRWSFGRVTLLGDAAHPILPLGSSGAAEAVLDGVALAQALTEEGDPVRGLARYEAARLGPTTELVNARRLEPPA